MFLNNRHSLLRGRPRMFTGGNSRTTNNLDEEYRQISSPTYQSIVDKVKSDEAAFNVDDYAYRVKKLHPEITKEQVEELYNKTPYVASDKVIEGRLGKFTLGDDNGYGTRVTIYPNSIKNDRKVKITKDNANEEISDVLAHETNHLYTDVLLKGNSDEEKDILWDAYRPGLVFGNSSYEEMKARNKESQSKISKQHNGAIGKELDNIIDNLSEDEVMSIYFDNKSGYINKDSEKHMKDKNGKWNRVDAIKKAWKTVASTGNPSSSFGIRRRLETRGSQSV